MAHQEDYVSFEQAQMLKELGFKEKCFAFYTCLGNLEINHLTFSGQHIKLENYNDDSINEKYKNVSFSAPTLSQVQKWLREKGMIVLAGYEPYKYWLIENDGPKWKYYINSKDSIHHSMAEFNSYEQALSAGIDKALCF